MKDICLIRDDLAAAAPPPPPIKLCVGEVVIGRGPLLECVDKRVSRSHGLLKLSDDGNILLVATHANPFYYMASGKKEKEVISQGKSITLQCGDKFSLLPDSYCYRVIFTDSKNTKTEIIMKEENKNHTVSATENDKTWCETLDEREDTETKSHKTIESKFSHALEKKEITEKRTSSLLVRKRVLPLWMLEDNVDRETPKKTKNIQPKAKKKEIVLNAGVKEKQMQEQFVEEPDPSGNTNEDYQLECTDIADKIQAGKKLHSISDDEQSNPDTSNNNQGTVQKISQHISDSEQSDNEQLNHEQQERSSAETLGNEQQSTSSPTDVTQSKSPNVTKQKRQQCKYGAACYRKNPQHREEFCHPGDEEFEDDSDKPECPYGISCYRKNQLHRQNFKHTTTPAKKQAQRQTKRKKKDENNYESDEDSYDEEDDPFINDASSDDYQPTDSGDSESISVGGEEEEEEEEGTRRMLKEAKRFVKKR